jgi:hypothetical protein
MRIFLCQTRTGAVRQNLSAMLPVSVNRARILRNSTQPKSLASSSGRSDYSIGTQYQIATNIAIICSASEEASEYGKKSKTPTNDR